MTSGSKPGRGKICFCSPRCHNQLYSPNNLLSYGYGVSFPRVKQPRSEANHSPLSSDQVKNEWSYISTPLYAFLAWTGMTTFCLYVKYNCYKMCCHKFRQNILAMPVPNRTYTAQPTAVHTLPTQVATEFLRLFPLLYIFCTQIIITMYKCTIINDFK